MNKTYDLLIILMIFVLTAVLLAYASSVSAKVVSTPAQITVACRTCLHPLVNKISPLKSAFVTACKLCARAVLYERVELVPLPVLISKRDRSQPPILGQAPVTELVSDKELLSLIEAGRLNSAGEVVIEMTYDESLKSYKVVNPGDIK